MFGPFSVECLDRFRSSVWIILTECIVLVKKSPTDLKDLTGIAIPQGTLNRGQVFDAVWPAFSTPVMKDGNILGVEKGVLENPVPPVVALEVNNVSADNLKEIKVQFNQKVDKENLGSFEIKGFSYYELTPELTQDQNVVKLVVNHSLRDQKEYTLVVNKTEAVSGGEKLSKTEIKFTPIDRERPEVEKVEFTGAKHITVTFSEPIWGKGELIIKQGGTTTVAPNLAQYTPDGTNVAVIPLVSDLKEDKEYTILIKNFSDYYGNHNINKEVSLTYNKATDSPTVQVVGGTPEYVRIRFSRPVRGLEAKLFHHTYSTWNAVRIEKLDGNSVGKNDIVHEVKVVFYRGQSTHHSLPEGIVKFMIEGDTIKDLYGNKLGVVEDKVSVNVDNEQPVVEECELEEGGIVKVVFSKPMNISLSDYKKVFVVESKGKSVFRSAAASKNDTEFKLRLKSVDPGSTLSIKIDHAKDKTVSGNNLVPFQKTIKYADTKGPSVTKAAVQFGLYTSDEVPNPGSFLYVFFDRELSGDYALDSANYQINKGDDYRTLTGEVSFFETSDVIKIQLSKKESEMVQNDGYDKIFVDKVTDLEGYPIVKKYVKMNNFTDINSFKPEKYTLKNDRQLEITFAQNITGYSTNAGDYTLSNSNLTVAQAYCEPGSKVLTLTLAKGQSFIKDAATLENTKLTIAKGALTGSFNASNTVTDIQDVDIIIADKANVAGGVEDKINPQIKLTSIVAGTHFIYDADNGKAYSITLESAPKKEIVVEFTRNLATLDPAAENAQLAEAIEVAVGDTVLNGPKGEVKFAVDSDKKVKITINGDYEGQVTIAPKNLSLLTLKDNNKLPVKFDKVSSTAADGETPKDLNFISPQVIGVDTESYVGGTKKLVVYVKFDSEVKAVGGALNAGDATLGTLNSDVQQVIADVNGKDTIVKFGFTDTAETEYAATKKLVIKADKITFKTGSTFQNHEYTYELKVKASNPKEDVWELIQKK